MDTALSDPIRASGAFYVARLVQIFDFDNCQVDFSAPLPDTIIQGSLADFRKACQLRRLPRLAVRASARRAEAVAMSVCSQSVATAPIDYSVPAQWMIDTANKHIGGQLKFGGGYVLCSKCGFMSSTRTDKRLHVTCRSHMPPGSASKVKRLLAGRIPFASQHEWSDGRPACEIVTIHSFESQAEAGTVDSSPPTDIVSASCEDEPQYESLHSLFLQPRFCITSDERISISFALDVALEAFKTGDDQLKSLRELGLPYESLDQGVCLWFEAHQHLADKLLLTWSDFDELVSKFVAEIRPLSFPWQ